MTTQQPKRNTRSKKTVPSEKGGIPALAGIVAGTGTPPMATMAYSGSLHGQARVAAEAYRVITEWDQARARNPDGYVVTNAGKIGILFEIVQKWIDYGFCENKVEQKEAEAALDTYMKIFRYDPDIWEHERRVVFDESMVAGKYRPQGKDHYDPNKISQRMSLVLYLLNEKNAEVEEALLEVQRQRNRMTIMKKQLLGTLLWHAADLLIPGDPQSEALTS